ncbi:MAG TPA: Gfo/Idh/MocA family oxidoreductase [candidate division Zixibacteria bacterium]|nr:Gfo/Idh/MocA family oxidoreductase [candidate division Zixibacteria bacterium]
MTPIPTIDAKVHVGFIGAGNWAEYNHMPTLQARDDVELVGIATPTQKSRDRVQQNFLIPYATPDYRQLLEQPLDAVVISSPHGYHYEQAKASLEADLHVLVEKPMTLKAAESWELVDMADKRGLTLMVPTGWHYNRMVIAAKEQMDQGAIGEVEYMICHLGSALRSLFTGKKWPYTLDSIPDPKAYYSDPSISGGGQGYSQLSHSVAMLLWLTGLRAKEVFAYMSGPDSPVDLYDAVVAKLNNGAIATISGAGTQPPSKTKHEMDIRIYGSEGVLSLDLYYEHLTVHREDGQNFALDVEPGDGDYACDGPLNRFIDVIKGESMENLSPGEVGARTIELIEAAYQSTASGKPIAL